MQTKLFYLLYLSTASVSFSKGELLKLLAKSRENNARLNVTGMLLYKNDSFQQMLEGPEQEVRDLFRKIRADPRHRGVIMLLEGFEDERQFPEWSMGFSDLDSEEAASHPGYTPFLDSSLTDPAFVSNPGTCKRLMLAFKKNTWT